MKAVIFEGVKKIAVVDRPIPKVQDAKDIIVRVQATALCGSELHVYRGLEKPTPAPGFIMGHEFTGIVTEIGSDVHTVQVGDKVVASFTISCMQCFFCKQGFSSRCVRSRLFGSPLLDGGQAEYVRVPWADGTVLKAPTGIDDRLLVLMCDIFPTGYYGARNAFTLLQPQEPADATVVVIGCGPVGLCTIIAALDFKPKHVFAVDSVDSRLAVAEQIGAEPLNFARDPEHMFARIRDVTEGRGADAVVEVVGLSPALRTAYEMLRPFGVISSIGVHNAEIPWNGHEAYVKNLKVQMGRCPVRSIFLEALDVMMRKQASFDFMFDKVMPLSDAVQGYELFDQMKAHKVVFTP